MARINFLGELLKRNLDHIAFQIFSPLPVKDLRSLRLVNKQWRHFIETEIMDKQEYLTREMEHSFNSCKPWLVDLDQVNESCQALLTGSKDWNPFISDTKFL